MIVGKHVEDKSRLAVMKWDDAMDAWLCRSRWWVCGGLIWSHALLFFPF